MNPSRSSGVLLHVSSLPGRFGIGDFGPQAYKFVDFLAGSNQRYWQVLPLTPPRSVSCPSPYDGRSAFALNTLLISPDVLYQNGLLAKKEIGESPAFNASQVQYRRVSRFKRRLFDLAFERFCGLRGTDDFDRFRLENGRWLRDWTLFQAATKRFRTARWCDWPAPIRDRDPQALRALCRELREAIAKESFLQHVAFEQWCKLHAYCREHGVSVIGDLPFYLSYESADVWAQASLFKLTARKTEWMIGGVPPDLFSKTGQLWGNPVYDWKNHRQTRYRWWIERLRHSMSLFDLVRIDHFRGLVAHWEVSARDRTAENGRWVRGPGRGLLDAALKGLRSDRIIAEDLGHITADVRRLLQEYRLTGMRVLLFGFDADGRDSPHLPHNHCRKCVVYTGTHDNNTVGGWFTQEATRAQRRRLSQYVGHAVSTASVYWDLVRMAMASVADTAILPMQDILGLSQAARMNRPAGKTGNWTWRMEPGCLTRTLRSKLAGLTQTYARA